MNIYAVAYYTGGISVRRTNIFHIIIFVNLAVFYRSLFINIDYRQDNSNEGP